MRILSLCLILLIPITLKAAPVQVFVSIPPQKTFVERIGGERVSVESLVKSGVDPHTYEPTPGQVARLSQADLFLGIGFPFERAWMERLRAVNPRMRVLDLSEGIAKRTLEVHDHEEAEGGHGSPENRGSAGEKSVVPAGAKHAEDSEHAPVSIAASDESERHAEHDHTEHELDPHLWTSLRLVKAMGEQIAAVLTELDPQHAPDYQAHLAAFLQDLDRLDEEIRAKLAGIKHRRFMVYHPSWGYFADDYGLIQIPIEKLGKEPGPKQLATLIEQARTQAIRVIFVQPQFSRKSAEEVARAIGGRVEMVDSLDPDYFASLRRMAEALAAADRD